jgi:integrase/recombinase XerD
LADATDLKSVRPRGLCGFDPRPRQVPPVNLRYQEVNQKLTKSFLESRRDGLSSETLKFYEGYLRRSVSVIGPPVTGQEIKHFLDSRQCSMAGKHAYYRVLRAFHNWLFSPRSGMGLNPWDNPMKWVDPPKMAKRMLPSPSKEEVAVVIGKAESPRDRARVSLFAESGLRLTELANMRLKDIDWGNRTIRTIGKGNEEALVPFGEQSERYLTAWLSEYQPNGSNVWGVSRWQIVQIR